MVSPTENVHYPQIDTFQQLRRPYQRYDRLFCGDGRTRTAVQTLHQAAFYALISPLIFDNGQPKSGRTKAYPLSLSGD